MPPQVVVVGSFVQDLTWRCVSFPRAGETVTGEFLTGPGGKGSNQAIAAGRAGAQTLFVGAVGADRFADDAAAFYRANRIKACFVRKPKRATGTAAILVSASGQNEIVVALGANAFLTRGDLPVKALQGARVLVTQLEHNLATAAFALKTVRRAGGVTILNPAPMRPDFDLGMLKDVDILVPNETEFVALLERFEGEPFALDQQQRLADLPSDQLHALCRRLGPPVVIVTLGDRGCLVSRLDGYTVIPPLKVKAVDTTGAGDAFVGGLAAGLVRFEGNPVSAARFANMVAALSVTRFGTAPAMPQIDEIARFARRSRIEF